MLIVAFRGFWYSIRSKLLANCVLHSFVDYVVRNARIFFRIKGDWKGCSGIYFTFTPPCGSLILWFLKEFYLYFFDR